MTRKTISRAGLALVTLALLATLVPPGGAAVVDALPEDTFEVESLIVDGNLLYVAESEPSNCTHDYIALPLADGSTAFTLTVTCIPPYLICYLVEVWGTATTSGSAAVTGATHGQCTESPFASCSASSAAGISTNCYNFAYGAGVRPTICIKQGIGGGAGASGSWSYTGRCKFHFIRIN